MRKIFILILPLLLSISCKKNQKDIIHEAIKRNISENALGIDIKYKSISLDSAFSVTNKVMLDVVPIIFGIKNFNNTEASRRAFLNTLDDTAKEEGNSVAGFYYTRYKSLMSLDPDEINYSVWKHIYSIKNPLFNNTDLTITNYYLFDKENKLIGHVEDKDYIKFSATFVHPYPESVKYEWMFYMVINGLRIDQIL
jgi:hypothetical protein